jgi:hypothetical protein
MALSDPQSVTIGTAISVPRTGSGLNLGAFTSADGNTGLAVSHQYGKRTRRTARVNFSKIAADPLISAQNIKYSASAYIVLDVPVTGFSAAEQLQIITGLTTWLTASTNANAVKVIGGES